MKGKVHKIGNETMTSLRAGFVPFFYRAECGYHQQSGKADLYTGWRGVTCARCLKRRKHGK